MNEELEGLGLIELLERLEPIPEPAPVSLFPQTPAWGVVGLLAAAALVWLFVRWRRHRRAEAYRRDALQAIGSGAPSPTAIAEILRRTALAAYPRHDVAGLHGEAWLAFLDRAYDGDGFRRGPGHVVATAPYARDEGADDADPALVALARTWIRRHRRTPEAGR